MAACQASAGRMAALALLLLLLPAAAIAYPALTAAPPDLSGPTRRVMTCSARQAQCLSQGYLPYYDGRCFEPLERGPCPDGEWFTLELAGAGALEGRCVPRPCPQGLLPAGDGHCLSEEEARARVCGGGAVHLDPAGHPRCGARRGWPPFLSAYVSCVQLDAPSRDDSNELRQHAAAATPQATLASVG